MHCLCIFLRIKGQFVPIPKQSWLAGKPSHEIMASLSNRRFSTKLPRWTQTLDNYIPSGSCESFLGVGVGVGGMKHLPRIEMLLFRWANKARGGGHVTLHSMLNSTLHVSRVLPRNSGETEQNKAGQTPKHGLNHCTNHWVSARARPSLNIQSASHSSVQRGGVPGKEASEWPMAANMCKDVFFSWLRRNNKLQTTPLGSTQDFAL